MSVSVDNFIKTIYLIKFDEKLKVSSTEMARKLNISVAAVTDMAKKLSSRKILLYKKYKEIELTEKGRIDAIKIIRKHRLWELFLNKVLGIPWDLVHKEAEMLEHQTSDKLADRLEEYLDFPKFDPHGDPIPDKKENFPDKKNEINLYDSIENKAYIVTRIISNDAEIVRFFQHNSISIGKKIKIIQILRKNNSINIEVEKKSLLLNDNIAKNIFIKPSTEN
ncbi:metal-dependent transcriptional regulator [Bacteroidota bacterium]